MKLRRKAGKPASAEPELLPALEPTRPPRPKREASSVPHVGPGGIIKEPQPLWPRLRRLLGGS